MMTKCTRRRYTARAPVVHAVSRPRNRVTSVATGSVLKRVLLGRKMSSDRLHETLLPKRLALPIFASDALSSVAYAPDEILIMLGLAGGAFAAIHSWQIALGVIT